MWRPLLDAVLLSASNVLIHALGSYAALLWIVTKLKKHSEPTLFQGWRILSGW